MGITGLLPFIKNACRSANIRDFKGSTVAVDAYSWLHKGAFSCAERLVKGEKTDGYVHYCMKQINMLLDAGLKPIMVFDGCNLESKAGTEKKRRENREKTKQKGKELLCQGKVREAKECFQRCVDVTPEMALEVIRACKSKNVDCIVAPYEADAQMAYLSKINLVQLVITEDSDLVVFGCERILFKMDSCGGGLLYEKENLPKVFGAQAEKMSFDKLRFMCILSGCDYLPSLPGIGLAKARKFVTVTSNPNLETVLPKLPNYLQMPKLTVTPDYVEQFVKANNTFLYQLVFCPKKKALVPLNPYPNGLDASELEYAGKYIPNELAVQIAMGEINVNTMREFHKSQENHKQYKDDGAKRHHSGDVTGSIWNDDISSQSEEKTENPFKYRQTVHKSPHACLPKKRSKTVSEAGETGDLMVQDELLFSAYNKEKSPVKKRKTSSLDSITEENEESRKENQEEKTSGKSLPATSLPFRKTLSPISANTTKKSWDNPFRKIVRSRFFCDQTDTKLKPKVSKLDSVDEEYNANSSRQSLKSSKDIKNSSDVCSNDKDGSIIFSMDIDFHNTENNGSCNKNSSLDYGNSSMESGICEGSGEIDSMNESYASVGSEISHSGASDVCDLVSELIDDDSMHPNSSIETSSPMNSNDMKDPVNPGDSPINLSPYFYSPKSHSNPDEEQTKVMSSSCPEKSSKPRGVLTKCKTLGLPKPQRRKLVKQLSAKDTLFNFNFTKLKTVTLT